MEEFKNNNFDENSNENVNESVNEPEVIEEVIAPEKDSVKKEIIDWAISIAVALALAFFIREFIFTLVRVDGPSMEPTLHHSDTLYVNRFMYEPEVGDVIIFRPRNSESTPYVKRVIATEGQVVEIYGKDGNNDKNGKVYVDGKELVEDYILADLVSAGTMEYPYTVPEDHVFVLGDNRNNSHDSRQASVGAVSEKSIIGKVLFRIFPLSDFGSIYD